MGGAEPGPNLRPRAGVVAFAAVAANRVIGSDGAIPWHLPGDLARFKKMTLDHALVMGRATYDSIGRALPGRTTVVLTRNPDLRLPDARTATDVAAAVALAAELVADLPVVVAGGGQVYRAAWPWLTRCEITEVDARPDGDVTFPELEPGQWQLGAVEVHDGWRALSYVRR